MGESLKEDHVLSKALRLMTAALDLLDEDGTVAAIGAQLDLARARLADHIDSMQTPEFD